MTHITLKKSFTIIATTLLFSSSLAAFADPDKCNAENLLSESIDAASAIMLGYTQPSSAVTRVACQQYCISLPNTDITSPPTTSTCMQNLSNLVSRENTLNAQNAAITALGNINPPAGGSQLGASNPNLGGTATPPPTTPAPVANTIKQAVQSNLLTTTPNPTNNAKDSSNGDNKNSIRWL